ncbi:MAG: transglutaminase family protein, partial [Patescibacteria group bacterium]
MAKRLLLLCFILLAFFFPTKVSAQQEFFVDAQVEYEVKESGTTFVTFVIFLENANPDLYAESYSLNLNSISPENVKGFYKGKEIDIERKKSGENVSLIIDFDDIVVGLGNSRRFTITFEDGSFAEKTGEVWEISIPRVEGKGVFRKYNVNLVIPASFGEEAFISPEAKEVREEPLSRVYTFEGRKISDTGINAAFGEFQVFSFSLKYHLENPLNKSAQTSIALPPDTSFQKLYYQKIEPVPEDVGVDADGNWIASYTFKPRQRIDIEVIGSVQIFSSPRKLSVAPVLPQEYYLEPTQYWQADDPEIKQLAENLKTPQRIYDYVSRNLEYDYRRVKPNAKRLGAKEALNNPSSAICMEFTDLFIALSRAAGIPAREINGYAYTENPDIQPLSLVADVLHSWPEYWDEERASWIPVDPTWASTTGGVDYFTKLDLRHFTFVIHGESDTKPFSPGSYKLGTNPQKDVYVSFGQLPQKRNSNIEISVDVSRPAPFMNGSAMVTIKNPGPVAQYDIHPQALFDGILVEEDFISVLPPYGVYSMRVTIPHSILGSKTPDEVKIIAKGSEVFVPVSKVSIVLTNLITITVILISVTIFMLTKAGKLPFTFLNIGSIPIKLKG